MRTKHCLAKNICCILESCRIYYSNCNYISLGRQQASSEIGLVWGNLMTLFCHVDAYLMFNCYIMLQVPEVLRQPRHALYYGHTLF